MGRKSIVSEISKTPAVVSKYSAETTLTTVETFQTSNATLYLPVVTFSMNSNIKYLEHLKQGFRRTISWNKHRCEITTQSKNSNFDYMIDPTFREY